MTIGATAAALAGAALLVAVPVADASRRPTATEKAKIIRAIKKTLGSYPASCITKWGIRVSTVDSHYALSRPTHKNTQACAADGSFTVKKQAHGKWVTMSCSSWPTRVKHDLGLTYADCG
jgi:hypothetical protein